MNASDYEFSFELFGPAHLVAISSTIMVSVALPVISRRFNSAQVTGLVCFGLSGGILAVELAYNIGVIWVAGWEVWREFCLPLHYCGMSIYLVPLALSTRNQTFYELAYFWGLAGAAQAIITPAITYGFPSPVFVRFFLIHGGIVAGVVFATFGLGLRPRLRGVWISFGLTLLFAAVVAGLNYALGGNYMFLREAPAGATPFYFLDWPWYIPFVFGLGLIAFLLLWLPFSRSSVNKSTAIK